MTDDDMAPGVRSPAARALMLMAVTTGLIVGGVYVAVDHLHSSAADAVEHPGPAATDTQAESEVVEHARDIVAVTGLRQPSAGYLLMSCKNRDDPPYQGAVYLNFELPSDVSADQYFGGVAAAMVARGWHDGPPPHEHIFGRNLSRDGVNAIFYPDTDSASRGVARIYGQCHDMSDHRGGARADWTDVTDRFR